MTSLVVEERAGVVTVSASSDGGPARVLGSHEFVSPANERELDELRWYLERYYEAPYGAYRLRAEAVGSNLLSFGKRLYASAFGALATRTIRELSGDTATVVRFNSTSAAFLRLPWELLHEPGSTTFAALLGHHILRGRSEMRSAAPIVISPRARLLFVVARPDREHDIAYTLIARPISKILAATGLRVEVLRPPTAEAFREALAASRRRDDPYAIVHFDGHGSLGLTPGDAREGCIYFVGSGGGATAIGAAEVATLLRDAGVQLAIFNACESARIDGATVESVVTSALIANGVPAALGMAYSVRASTAERFMSVFYARFAAGASLTDAVADGRSAVARGAGSTDSIVDWFVPALYTTAQVSLTDACAVPGMLEGQGDDFVGRDLEFQRLEETLSRTDRVLICGVIGIGKTRILREFSSWLQNTHGISAEAVTWLDMAAAPDLEVLDHFLARCRSRDGRRRLLIVDHLEALDLVPSAVNKLREALDAPDAVKLLASRRPEPWLEDIATVPLFALSRAAARRRLPQTVPPEEIELWLDACGGHPRCLERLPGRVPVQSWPSAWEDSAWRPEDFEAVDHVEPEVMAALGALGDRDHARSCMLTFFGIMFDSTIPMLASFWQTHDRREKGSKILLAGESMPEPPERFRVSDPGEWLRVIEALERLGLASRIGGSLFQVHPAAASGLYRRWSGEPGFAAEVRAQRQILIGVLSARCFNQDQLEEISLPLRFLRPLLHRACIAAVRDGWPYDAALLFQVLHTAVEAAFGLDAAARLRGELRDAVVSRLGHSPLPHEPEHLLWTRLLTSQSPFEGRAVASVAEEEARHLLALPGDAITTQQRVFALHTIGAAHGERGELDLAARYYHQSIEAADDKLDPQLFFTYRNLVVTALQRRTLAEARKWLEMAKLVARNTDQPLPEEHLVSMEGLLAVYAGDTQDAIHLQDSVLESTGSPSWRAATMHELGIAFQEAGRLDEAEMYYRESLKLKEQVGRRDAMRSTFHMLGSLAMERGDLAEGETWLRQALSNHREHRFHEAPPEHTVSLLADNLGRQGRPEDARALLHEHLTAPAAFRGGGALQLAVTSAEYAQRSKDYDLIIRTLEPLVTQQLERVEGDAGPVLVGRAKGILAEAYMVQGRHDEALAIARAAVAGLRQGQAEGQSIAFQLAHALVLLAILSPETDQERVELSLEAAELFLSLVQANVPEAGHYLMLSYVFSAQYIEPSHEVRVDRLMRLLRGLMQHDLFEEPDMAARAIIFTGKSARRRARIEELTEVCVPFVLRAADRQLTHALAQCLYETTQEQAGDDAAPLPSSAQLDRVCSLLRGCESDADSRCMLAAYLAFCADGLARESRREDLVRCRVALEDHVGAEADPRFILELAKLLMYLVTCHGIANEVGEARNTMDGLLRLGMHPDASPHILVVLAPAARNMAILLMQRGDVDESLTLSRRYMEIFARQPDAIIEMSAELSMEFWTALASRFSEAGAVDALREHMVMLEGAASLPGAGPKLAFVIANCWLNAGNRARALETFLLCRNHLAALAARCSDPRILGGAMLMDTSLVRVGVDGEDEQLVGDALLGIIDAWKAGAHRIDPAAGAWKLLVEAVGHALPLLQRRRSSECARVVARALDGVSIDQPAFDRLKRQLASVAGTTR